MVDKVEMAGGDAIDGGVKEGEEISGSSRGELSVHGSATVLDLASVVVAVVAAFLALPRASCSVLPVPVLSLSLLLLLRSLVLVLLNFLILAVAVFVVRARLVYHRKHGMLV